MYVAFFKANLIELRTTSMVIQHDFFYIDNLDLLL